MKFQFLESLTGTQLPCSFVSIFSRAVFVLALAELLNSWNKGHLARKAENITARPFEEKVCQLFPPVL